ncbi:uncharacterized protein LOC134830273 isoform X2 [Culicoides brevitarsis]|uniref:uncharacterized protein LOC134830273 isoform X2 n=1 Tax=Culicoides brevitarsis TaxID=469753 RepID=UPI00307C6C48
MASSSDRETLKWAILSFALWGHLFVSCSANQSPPSVQLCNESLQHIAISSSGRESSLIVDLSPSSQQICQKTFLTEPRHAFFIRLLRITRPHFAIVNEMQSMKHLPNFRKTKEYSCPLEISVINDTMRPAWKIDPCKLEYDNLSEDSRLQPGQLQIKWKNNGYSPAVKLLVTVIGKDEVCLDRERFVCLGFGEVPLLCIAKELACDGIEHCPSGLEMRNDEDLQMCDGSSMNVWQQLSLNFLKGILRGNGPDTAENEIMPMYSTTERTGPPNPRQKSTLTRGLARYGPWGYLMLGMLVCGAALLICGLWECCCRRFKPELDDSLSSLDNPSIIQSADNSGISPSAPPNYEELDSPPAYAILFPVQKSPDSTVGNNEQNNSHPQSENTRRASVLGSASSSQHL